MATTATLKTPGTAVARAGFLLLTMLSLAQALFPKGASCPSGIRTVEDFDVAKYAGLWYEYSKYPFIFEYDGKCIYAQYDQQDDGNVSVYNYNINRITSKVSDIMGSARIVSSGKLKVQFQNMPAFLGGADYWVLGTDYDNYAVVYSCNTFFGLFRTQVVWILTRERDPSEDTVNQAKQIITDNGLSLQPLERTDQSNCPEDK